MNDFGVVVTGSAPEMRMPRLTFSSISAEYGAPDILSLGLDAAAHDMVLLAGVV